ncbi:MAG: diacylglycerol kinase family protein [bacterium]
MSEKGESNKSRNFLLVFNNEAGKSCHKKDIITNYLTKNKYNFKIIDAKNINGQVDFSIYDTVVAIGGDGTVLKIIPYLANTNINLGIIPCGTANLFAASLCIPSNIQKAVNILLNGTATRVDIGKADNEYFALRVGFGYDADVVNGTKKLWKKKLGYLAYFIQGVINCFKLSNKSYKITIDNKILEVNANSIIVANAGNMFKNFFTIAPLGSINDGKLDIFILLARNFWEFLDIFIQILFGKHNLNPRVIYRQARNIKIESNYKNIHIDGEPYYNSNLDISIIPKALMVMVP